MSFKIPKRHYYFAGGGTGGHIYPNLALAEKIREIQPDMPITFITSSREIDAQIMGKSGFDFLPIPAISLQKGFKQIVNFFALYFKSYYFIKEILRVDKDNAVVIATGGFVSAPVVFAARKLKIPVYLVNVDSIPGKANKLLARFVSKVFLQYELASEHFGNCRTPGHITGCPLRSSFDKPDAQKAIADLGLDPNKKTLVVTGASSGSRSINDAMIELLPELNEFDGWQVVHLTGHGDYDRIKSAVENAQIDYYPVQYYEGMADLLAAANLIVGRSGAVSCAEYVKVKKPVICVPYPYHKDKHQTENAKILKEVGLAVIAEDVPGNPTQTAMNLRGPLIKLMSNDQKRFWMTQNKIRDIYTNGTERILQLLGKE